MAIQIILKVLSSLCDSAWGSNNRKHFTIDNNLEGADHSMSADPKVFKKMVEMCEDFKIMLGNRRLNNHYDCEKIAVPPKN